MEQKHQKIKHKIDKSKLNKFAKYTKNIVAIYSELWLT